MTAEWSLAPNVSMLSPNCNDGGLNVLILQTQFAEAESTAAWLGRLGHRAQIAVDGLSACQAAMLQAPDVVLLELALPDMDGWEIAERLQASTWGKKPFLIALADRQNDRDCVWSLEVGIDLHLVKPVDSEFLRWVLARFCQVIKQSDVWPEDQTSRDSAWRSSTCEVWSRNELTGKRGKS